MKTEIQIHQEMVQGLIKDIFAVFARHEPPLGAAANAAAVVLVRIAIDAKVTKKELISSIKQTWTQVRAVHDGPVTKPVQNERPLN